MSAPEELFLEPESFSGRARLFPLPNLVLFPHVLQPLHVFEPRYRTLVEEALASDRLIAMALLQPGWEGDYEGRPPIAPVACLGRITAHHRFDDGRYNLLLAGLKRLRIVSELEPDKLFREAQVKLHEDFYPIDHGDQRPAVQRRLLAAFRRLLPQAPEVRDQVEQLLAGEVCLGTLTDIIAYSLDLDVLLKQRLLAEQNVDRRATLLVAHMEQCLKSDGEAGRPASDFPPLFSSN